MASVLEDLAAAELEEAGTGRTQAGAGGTRAAYLLGVAQALREASARCSRRRAPRA